MFRNLDRKIFHVIMVIIMIFVIVFVAGIFILKYQVEGETNMPFEITKIAILESVEGIENENSQAKWDFNVSQNNDIYVYIEKNKNYKKTEIIEEIEINNINIERESAKGKVKLYKPSVDEKRMFLNSEENEISNIKYFGDMESNVKEQKISNQGGKVIFRYAINDISKYISNEGEQVDHSQLLKLTDIGIDDVKTKLMFDIIIKLKSGKKYKATIELNRDNGDIIEKGTIGTELPDVDNIVFKRVEN